MCWEDKSALKCVRELGYTAWAFILSTHISVKPNLYAFAERLRKQENVTKILLAASFSKSTWYIHVLTAGVTVAMVILPQYLRLPGKTGTHSIKIRKLGCIFRGRKQRCYGNVTLRGLPQASDLRMHTENHEVQVHFGLCKWQCRNYVYMCVCIYVTHTHFTFSIGFLFQIVLVYPWKENHLAFIGES